MKETDDVINVVYVRFDKNLDYKMIVNSYYIKKFLESVYGDIPKMMSPTKFTFDRDKLGVYIQNQYDKSKDYIIERKKLPSKMDIDYMNIINQKIAVGKDNEPDFVFMPYLMAEMKPKLDLVEFETELLLDDHIVTVNSGDRVLGVFTTELDFEHIIDEL